MKNKYQLIFVILLSNNPCSSIAYQNYVGKVPLVLWKIQILLLSFSFHLPHIDNVYLFLQKWNFHWVEDKNYKIRYWRYYLSFKLFFILSYYVINVFTRAHKSFFSVPLTGDVNIISHKTIFENLMKKNLTLLSEKETGFFLSFKESQYALRRERIEEYCSERDQKFGKKIVKNSLIYDDVDGVSYCQIAKVASSSWCNHFIKLGNLIYFQVCWALWRWNIDPTDDELYYKIYLKVS